jgi:putative endonuclease
MEKSMEEKSNQRKFGDEGEKIAVDYLTKNNYKIIDRNFRVGRLGEIDIIARENEYLCFIEVKTRTSLIFGMPSEAVNKRKRRSIIKLASIYMNRYRLTENNARFDIVEIIVNTKTGQIIVQNINIIKNAFYQQ